MEHLWLTGLDINDLMEGHLYHLMGGAFMTSWVGHLSVNGWGTYGLNGMGQLLQSRLLLRLEICSKNCWSSGEYPFRSSHDHRFRSL